jgi:hypothetical protein
VPYRVAWAGDVNRGSSAPPLQLADRLEAGQLGPVQGVDPSLQPGEESVENLGRVIRPGRMGGLYFSSFVRLTTVDCMTGGSDMMAGMRSEEAREMVLIAANFLAEQMPDVSAKDIRLEQIEEQTGRDEFWIVLSYPDPIRSTNSLQLALAGPQRSYKELILQKETKEVKSLKVWKK